VVPASMMTRERFGWGIVFHDKWHPSFELFGTPHALLTKFEDPHRCRPVRSSAFFTNAHREPLNAVAAWRSPADRSWFQVCRRTSSNAFVAQATMWYGSRQSAAFGGRALNHGVDPLGAVGGDMR
jgi:hypothetical protein